jgi:hypothetical protein
MTRLNPDFRDILSTFNAEGVEYLIVGGYALAAHGLPRATGDFDLWVRTTRDNAARVYSALAKFGAPMNTCTVEDFASEDLIFQIGVEPVRIDVMTSVEGLTFESAWPGRLTVALEGVTVNVVGRDDLIANKSAVGRPQDRADVVRLKKQPPRRQR